MKFKVYDNAYDFGRKIEPILLEKEDVFSLFFGVLQGRTFLTYRDVFYLSRKYVERNNRIK